MLLPFHKLQSLQLIGGGRGDTCVEQLFSECAWGRQHEDHLGGGSEDGFFSFNCDIIDITLGQFEVYSILVC